MQSLHPSLSSARLITSLHVIIMHRMSSRIVSCEFFCSLPLLRFPSRLQSKGCTAGFSPFIQGCRRAGTVRSGVPALGIKPEPIVSCEFSCGLPLLCFPSRLQSKGCTAGFSPFIQGCRRAGTVRSGVPALGIKPERVFRQLLSNQRERFVLSVPAHICNRPKKVIQYFAEEETRNFRKII